VLAPTRTIAESALAQPLPFEPFVFGIITLVVFAALGFVMWSYRDVANRHRGTTVTNVDAHPHDRLDEHAHVR
jgi:hypothetical protein